MADSLHHGYAFLEPPRRVGGSFGRPLKVLAGAFGVWLAGRSWLRLQPILGSLGSPDEPPAPSKAPLPSGPYMPPDLNLVMVKAGAPGPLQLTAAGQPNKQPCSLFLYSGKVVVDINSGTNAEAAVVYGARTVENTINQATPKIALPTGDANDVVKGQLITFPPTQFKGKLEEMDKVQGYKEDDDEHTSLLRRALVSAVREDGTTRLAYWYYQAPPGNGSLEKVLRAQIPTTANFAKFGWVLTGKPDGAPSGGNEPGLDLSKGTPRLYLMSLKQPSATLTFDRITHHKLVTQSLLSNQFQPWYVGVAAPGTDPSKDLEAIQAFCVPPGVGLMFKAGTWHAGPHFTQPNHTFVNLELDNTNVIDHTTVKLPRPVRIAPPRDLPAQPAVQL